jgi:hypothetical protein
MKKLAVEVFNQGLEHHNSSTKQVCEHALEMMKTGGQKIPKKTASKQKIQEVPSKKSKRKRKLQQTNWNR